MDNLTSIESKRSAMGLLPALRLMRFDKRVAAALFASGIAALGGWFLMEARPYIGGVDFYYYVLTARDLASGAADVSLDRYAYFPGVFSFWKAVFLVTDGSLASLQWALVGVLAMNALLVGAILASVTGSRFGGALAASVYVFEASRIEGLEGTTEPISTVPYLAGLWLWVFLSKAKKTHAGLWALAAGFGLALFSKQQGGLLALGALGLVPAIWSGEPARRYVMSQLLILPLGATAVFLSAMWLEGGGWSALKAGLVFASEYHAQGSWIEHVNRVWELTQPVSNFFLSGCALWLVLLIVRNRIPVVSDAALLTLGVSIFTVVACLLQFSKRGYLHYALLLLPSAVIAAGLAIFIVVKWLHRQADHWPQWRHVIIMVGAVAFLLGNSAGLPAFADEVASRIAVPARWKPQEVVGRAFLPLCDRLPPGARLLLIPPRENKVHWFCRTRPFDSKIKNPWESPDPGLYRPLLASSSLEHVFVFARNYGWYEQRFFEQGDWDTFLLELERSGFQRTMTFQAGTLYQKTGWVP